MLRKLLDYQLEMTEEGKPLAKMRPLISALDTFLYEPKEESHRAPHIRDAVDVKRWMILVVVALLPAILMAIWNSGLQRYVYASQDRSLMEEFLSASTSFHGYYTFVMKDDRWWRILLEGAALFIPIVIVSYTVGGIVEALFAVIRGHDIAEGFLVSGILYPLVLPPTVPLWIVAVGVAFGIILSKELFGGTGMNIVNPALSCRALVFFCYPGNLSGNVWVGRNTSEVAESLKVMNQGLSNSTLDGYSQTTALANLNVSAEIKRIHIDALASNIPAIGHDVSLIDLIQKKLALFGESIGQKLEIGSLSKEQLFDFVTGAADKGGLALSPALYENAVHFATTRFGLGIHSDANLFFGNKLGCFGETSGFACILGAIFLIITGIGSWRTMAAVILGVFTTASCFQWSSTFGADNGAWNIAQHALPAYKHFLLGGLAFGLVFMATDPVSSPSSNLGKWVYGFFIGLVTVMIRLINPAYPEGVMLAILLGNVFAPLIDHYCLRATRRRRYRAASA